MINCKFCQQNLKSISPSGLVSNHHYICDTCHVHYRTAVRGEPSLGTWEELLSYHFVTETPSPEEFTLYCNLLLPEHCSIIRNGRVILRLPYIPNNLSPNNWLQRTKTWALFS